MRNKEEDMRTDSSIGTVAAVLVALPLIAVSCCLPISLQAQQQAAETQAAPSSAAQRQFATPEQALDALVQAADPYDVNSLIQILGPGSKDLVDTGDAVQDKNRGELFAARAKEKKLVTVDPKNSSRATITMGSDNWPFAVPVIKKGGKWSFDSKSGLQEILYRRIGTNELDAIQVCRGFVDAEEEYALTTHDDSGINQYAQKIISTPGKHDGLYWKNEDGSSGGPIGEAVAKAIEEGYSSGSGGYHGYYFKVLKGQGPAARLGQLDYLVEGAMIGGFALVAVPVHYRVTGVKTFIVSYDGIVYQKDLGQDSLNIVKSMDRYNPDKTWQPTDDQWPPDIEAAD
jgi:Protein of unknown function (DUF2950)